MYLFLTTFVSASQFHVYLLWVNTCLAWHLNSVLNVKALVGAFNQVGAFSVKTGDVVTSCPRHGATERCFARRGVLKCSSNYLGCFYCFISTNIAKAPEKRGQTNTRPGHDRKCNSNSGATGDCVQCCTVCILHSISTHLNIWILIFSFVMLNGSMP